MENRLQLFPKCSSVVFNFSLHFMSYVYIILIDILNQSTLASHTHTFIIIIFIIN